MTISDKDWFKKNEEAGGNDRVVVLLEHLCNMGVWVPEGRYEAWIELNAGDPIDVASSPPEASVDAFRKSFMTICREKLFSVVDTWNTLAEKLVDDGIVEKPPTVEFEEVIEFITKNWKVEQAAQPSEKGEGQ